jgi:hypothetical protein
LTPNGGGGGGGSIIYVEPSTTTTTTTESAADFNLSVEVGAVDNKGNPVEAPDINNPTLNAESDGSIAAAVLAFLDSNADAFRDNNPDFDAFMTDFQDALNAADPAKALADLGVTLQVDGKTVSIDSLFSDLGIAPGESADVVLTFTIGGITYTMKVNASGNSASKVPTTYTLTISLKELTAKHPANNMDLMKQDYATASDKVFLNVVQALVGVQGTLPYDDADAAAIMQAGIAASTDATAWSAYVGKYFSVVNDQSSANAISLSMARNINITVGDLGKGNHTLTFTTPNSGRTYQVTIQIQAK